MSKAILFVDDEEAVLAGVRRSLRSMRDEWDLSFACGGREALAAVDERPFDVVVTDMRMPEIDGVAVLSHVKERRPDAVRIVLSGFSDTKSSLEAVAVAHQWLNKPCEAELLRETLARACFLQDVLGSGEVRRLAAQLTSIPSMPSLYLEILREMASLTSSIESIGRIVARDVGMTAKVLQLVNSAFFGLPQHISDPARAAAFLGIDTLRSLVLALDVFQQYGPSGPRGVALAPLFDHSANTGGFARAIARAEEAPRAVVENAYLAGLLHDVGKLVLAANLPDEYAEVVRVTRERGLRTVDAEREVLGASHAEVGGYLLGIWGLPTPVVEAIACHHRPGEAPEQSGFSALTAVHAANALDKALAGGDEAAGARELDLEYLSSLGLADRVDAWRAACLELLESDDAEVAA